MDEIRIQKLMDLASASTFAERVMAENPDMFVADAFDGDCDDAYMSGEFDGKILLAREILDELGIAY